jgi:hypothetical protein
VDAVVIGGSGFIGRRLGYAPIVEPGEARARTIAWLRTQPI